MALSPSTIKEIQAELQGLQQWKAKIEEREKALHAILVPFDLGQAGLPFSHRQDGVNGNGAKANTAPKASASRLTFTAATSSADSEFRSVVLTALGKHGPNRAPSLAKVIDNEGFKNDSPTALKARVYNFLWRLSKVDGSPVELRDGGVFAMKS